MVVDQFSSAHLLGTYNMQKRWVKKHNQFWDEGKAQRSAKKMYDKIWNMKFLPPGN
jgi:hypothetical protein